MGGIPRVHARRIAMDAARWLVWLNFATLTPLIPEDQVVRAQSQGFADIFRIDSLGQGQSHSFGGGGGSGSQGGTAEGGDPGIVHSPGASQGG